MLIIIKKMLTFSKGGKTADRFNNYYRDRLEWHLDRKTLSLRRIIKKTLGQCSCALCCFIITTSTCSLTKKRGDEIYIRKEGGKSVTKSINVYYRFPKWSLIVVERFTLHPWENALRALDCKWNRQTIEHQGRKREQKKSESDFFWGDTF